MGRWGWGPHSPWIKMTLGMEVRLSPGDFVLDGDPAPPKKGRIPQFSAHVYCGQTAAWIKMPLGPHRAQRRLCARWGPSSPQEKEHTHPHQIFGPCLLWPNGCMDQDATWYGSRPRPRPHCNRRGQSSPRKGHSSPPPLFGPCLLWSRSPISATAELLLRPTVCLDTSLLVSCNTGRQMSQLAAVAGLRTVQRRRVRFCICIPADGSVTDKFLNSLVILMMCISPSID